MSGGARLTVKNVVYVFRQVGHEKSLKGRESEKGGLKVPSREWKAVKGG